MRAKGRSKGFFISFEGGEGAGKSTQIRHLVQFLKDRGYPVTVTLEPGGTSAGERIREVLLNPERKALSARAELLLYISDRAQHVHEVIRPALEKGRVVITDRYADSSVVYQGYCRGLGVDWVKKLNSFATGGLSPDLTVLLDLPETEGRRRIRRRIREDVWLKGVRKRVKLDRLEREKRSFHRKVRKGFLMLSKTEPRRFLVIPAHRSEAEVKAQLLGEVGKRLERRRGK